MTEERRGRGRPRPEATVKRDAEVLDVLKRSGMPVGRKALADMFGVNQNIVYLSLVRLRRDGLVSTVRQGKHHLWAVVEQG